MTNLSVAVADVEFSEESYGVVENAGVATVCVVISNGTQLQDNVLLDITYHTVDGTAEGEMYYTCIYHSTVVCTGKHTHTKFKGLYALHNKYRVTVHWMDSLHTISRWLLCDCIFIVYRCRVTVYSQMERITLKLMGCCSCPLLNLKTVLTLHLWLTMWSNVTSSFSSLWLEMIQSLTSNNTPLPSQLLTPVVSID